MERHATEQGRVFLVLNFPCHNPTGYSLSPEEWDGVAEVVCGGTSVFALSELPVGASVLLSVRPEDVTLFESTSELPTSSARNCLRCAVTDVSHRGPTVRVVVESGGVRLAALVSRASARELALAPGATVVALFKATATRAVAARQEGEHR
jgi:molybdopterin-binding protein